MPTRLMLAQLTVVENCRRVLADTPLRNMLDKASRF